MASEDLPANGYGGPADLPAPHAPKQRLRRTMRAARAAFVASLTPEIRALFEAQLATVLGANLPPASTNVVGRVIAGYAPRGGEIDPGPAAVFPRVTGTGLAFHRCLPPSLVPGFAGIAEPDDTAAVVDPDIILVPLVAVDARGNRLGQGAGHYDRTLAALRARRPVLAVGVAWDMQLIDALPADLWDEPLDALATPSRWLTFPGRTPISRR